MNLAWNYENVMISAIATVEITSGPIVRGTGTKGSQPFEWEATLTATGWEIAISSLRGPHRVSHRRNP